MKVRLTEECGVWLPTLRVNQGKYYKGLWDQVIRWSDEGLLESGDWKLSIKGNSDNFKALSKNTHRVFVKYPKLWQNPKEGTFADGAFFLKKHLIIEE